MLLAVEVIVFDEVSVVSGVVFSTPKRGIFSRRTYMFPIASNSNTKTDNKRFRVKVIKLEDPRGARGAGVLNRAARYNMPLTANL